MASLTRSGEGNRVLDTLPAMQAAIALYRAPGFAPIPAPADDAGLGQLYFVRTLASG